MAKKKVIKRLLAYRRTWNIKPIEKVKDSKKLYNRKHGHWKKELE